MKESKQTKKLTLYIQETKLDEVKKLAKQLDIRVNELIIISINEFLKNYNV